jgi:hypothetical protein
MVQDPGLNCMQLNTAWFKVLKRGEQLLVPEQKVQLLVGWVEPDC